jgi:hypothetical protein
MIPSGADGAVEGGVGPVTGQAARRLPHIRATDGRGEVLGAGPVGDVHELELGVGRDGLMQSGVDIAGLRLQVVTSLLPGDDELLRIRRRHLERIDQDYCLRHVLNLAD